MNEIKVINTWENVKGKLFLRLTNYDRKILDEKYPKGDKIQLILDNHSAHTSRETQEYLNTVPGRFEFVFTSRFLQMEIPPGHD